MDSLSLCSSETDFSFLSETTTQLYLAINCLPWTLVTLCEDISVTFIMRLLTRL